MESPYRSGMRGRLIISIAAACGGAAFLWTLLSHPQWREAPFEMHPSLGTGNRMGVGAMRVDIPRNLESLEKAAAEGSDDYLVWNDLASLRVARGDTERAREAWRRAATLAGEQAGRTPRSPRPWFELGWANGKLGDTEGERQAYSKAGPLYEALMPGQFMDVGALIRVGRVRRRLGDEAGAHEAWELGEKRLSLMGPDTIDPTAWYNLACFRSMLGETGPAMEALAHAAETGYADAAWAKADDDLEAIRGEPAFAALVHKMEMQRPHAGP
jgi:tetratricopeptide (TPR) repeat protein